MKNPWLELKEEIAKKVGVEVKEIEEPENYGDLAVPCFSLSKKLRKNPAEIAKDLEKGVKIDGIKELKAIGSYLNFYVDWTKFSKKILESIDDKYGSWNEKEIVMMDVFQANPFKSFHIGHVRNAVIGESIRRILEFSGKKTITVNYNGDVGIHVARWLLYYNKYFKGKIPKKDFTKWSGEIYAKASKLAKDDPKFEEEAQKLNIKIDKRDKSILKQWKKIRDLCYKDFENIRKELDVKVDYMMPESECEEPGKDMVMKLYNEEKLVKSEGAIGINLEQYGLGFFIFLKSDGTSIYATKDMGLLQLKKKYKFDKMIYVVGSEQDYYFKQLLKAFDLLELYPLEKSKHVSYGLVTLKEGKMASRLGNVILYEDLRDEMIKSVKEKFNVKDDKLAAKIAFGAIKFYMLSFDNNTLIKFDWDQALDIEGKTGPYLQYAYARASSILNKEKPKGKINFSVLEKEQEVKIIKKIAVYPEIIKKSADQYNPSILVNYLFEMAQEFNTFYNSVPVLKADTDEIKSSRLKLVESVSKVLESGLNLLGIEKPKVM